jgi:hypothetical protein
VELNLRRREAALLRRRGAGIPDGWGGSTTMTGSGGGEANLGAATTHLEGVGPRTIRSGLGPAAARAGEAARSADAGSVNLHRVNGGSTATKARNR